MEKTLRVYISKITERKNIIFFVKQIICCVFCFMLTNVSFEDEINPFGLAFAGGMSEIYILSGCLGTALGALVFCSPARALRYVSACVLLFFFRMFITKKFRATAYIYLFPCLTFSSLLLSGLSLSLALETDLSGFVLLICDAVIAGAASLFSYGIFIRIEDGGFYSAFSAADFTALMLWGTLVLYSFSDIEIKNFSLSLPFVFFVLLVISHCSGETAGLIAGICLGAVFGAGENHPQLMLALSLSGLVCSLMREHGKTAQASVFAAVNTVAVILKGNPVTAFADVSEAIIISLVFSLLPKRFFAFVGDRLAPFARAGYKNDIRQLMTMQIKRSAKAVRDVAFSTEAVLRLLSRSDVPDIHGIPEEAKEDICSDCLKYDYCWRQNKKYTDAAFYECLKNLNETGRLTPENLPERLGIICREKNSLCDSFNRLLCEYSARLTARREIFEAKLLAASQFRCSADIIEDAASSISPCDTTDLRLTSVTGKIFSSFGFEYTCLFVTGAKTGRCVIELFCTKIPSDTDYNALVISLEQKTDIAFSMPRKEEYKNEGTLLLFCEKTEFTPLFGKLSRTSDGEKLCGDYCEAFSDGRGNFYGILSDGMGTGTRAAVDSLMTASLFAKLMKAGFGVETAFTAVNSALKVKSADEALATLDVIKINLFTGQAELFKAGASYSVLKNRDGIHIKEQSSLPLGILGDTHFEKTRFTLKKGDTFLMFSDGAAPVGLKGFSEILRANEKASPAEICPLVIEAATKASPSGKTDDITALCIKIT